MNISFEKLFYVIASVVGILAILIVAKTIIIPLCFALLISFILFPLSKKYEAWGVNRIFSSVLSMISLLTIIGSGFLFFSREIFQVGKQVGQFQDKVLEVFAEVTLFINRNINFIPNLEKDELFDELRKVAGESIGQLLSQTFSSTTSILTGVLTSIIFTFLFLVYRSEFVSALTQFFSEGNRQRARTMFLDVQKVGQRYLLGMFVMISILGTVNSLGLWLIGIDNAFLFGFLAGILAIIPYVGTVFGASIPIVYTFIAYDSLWLTFWVALMFWFVQLIESNVLSPKIVGGSLKLNALAAILSIIIGASVWGIAGMVLFLPLTAMLKVVSEQFKQLQPLALLIGDDSEVPKSKAVDFVKKVVNKKKSLSD